MNLKNLKIATQLRLGIALLLLFVVVLGIVADSQTFKLHQQAETIYNHPLKVRRAIGMLIEDFLEMRIHMRGLPLARNDQEIYDIVEKVDVIDADARKQIDILYEKYLGPRSDVDDASTALMQYKANRAETIRLLRAGNKEEVISRLRPDGIAGLQAAKALVSIKVIDEFATKKGDTIYASSSKSYKVLRRQLILLVTAILVISFIINYILLKSIRTPLAELTDAARHFHEGDLEARCDYESKNEFGELSVSFNTLAASIQATMELNEKAANLAGLMLSEDDARTFFRETLGALSQNTGSQLAAVYLLSSDKKTFEHFDSVGLDDRARQSFAADFLEGEFGSALYSRTLQHIKNIPENTRFVFNTVSGTFIPREIITIPILAANDVTAIISLASVGSYDKQSLQFLETILDTLCARIAGILAYRTIKDFSVQLEHQNRELESQKTELATQSAELMIQNTELEMQKKQLNEANRLKTNFLSNMSHELRTPLNSVIALSGVLNRRLARQIPEEEYSYLEVIERNGKHLLSLINDILDISRIEAGREEIEITTFNANSLIADVAGMIHPQAQQRNIELLHTGGETNLTVSSDAGKCRHILQNLIGNAVKFTEEGTVQVSARQRDNDLEIAVTDTGIGIDEAHLPHIFDEFRQADGSTSRKFGGTGLGLAIAQKYAHLLGGTISVTSTPGRGSEFTLSLPLRYSAKNRIIEEETPADFSPAIPAPPRPASASSLKTILLVEDSEPAIIQLKDTLEEGGYRILVAHDGGEALGIIEKTVPDAMIVDLMMPGIDGFNLLKTIREVERTAHIPVLILTARHITKDELKFLKRNNIHQLIQKGDVNRAELQNSVATMVFPETVETRKPLRSQQTIEGKPQVLIVEDNPDNMITVKALLDGIYSVIEALDGQQGVEMARMHRPHLILMDIALPGMNGIEAFKAIRSDPLLQHIPVIALTASAMVSDRETILAHGFDAYIAKPINEKLLTTSINEVLYGE